MASAPLPSGLRTARMIAYLQGGVGIFAGVLFVLGGSAFATALGLGGLAGTAAVIAIGVALAVASGLLIWGATLLGTLSARARIGVLVLEYLALVLAAFDGAGVWQAGFAMVIAVVVIYYLQFDRLTRAAFAAGGRATPPPPG